MTSTSSFRVIGIGEILWDEFPEGKKLGGAPTNFAFHAGQIGLESGIISAVGNDALGKEILEILQQQNIRNFVSSNDKPTGRVSVKLDREGVPVYIIHEEVAWDYIKPTADALEFSRKADAICFGTLGQRSDTSRSSINRVLQSAPDHALIIFDINLRQSFYSKQIIEASLHRANVLKINEEEIRLFAEMFNISGDEFEIMNRVRERFGLRYLALTRGSEGSWLIGAHEKSFLDTPRVKVVDTVGAGDSFTAAMAAGFLHELSLQEVHQFAVDVSAFVCTREGATPELPDTLIKRLQKGK